MPTKYVVDLKSAYLGKPKEIRLRLSRKRRATSLESELFTILNCIFENKRLHTKYDPPRFTTCWPAFYNNSSYRNV